MLQLLSSLIDDVDTSGSSVTAWLQALISAVAESTLQMVLSSQMFHFNLYCRFPAVLLCGSQ